MAVDYITGELIKSAVARAINARIPEEVVYKERQPQQAEDKRTGAAFYISERRISLTPQLRGQVQRDHEINVRYEPPLKANDKAEQCAILRNILMEALILLDLPNGKVWGRNIAGEIIDEVLIIEVTYTVNAATAATVGADMETLKIESEVK